MAKKLTLNQTWTLCLKKWKWIAERWKEGGRNNIFALKREWLENHGYKDTLRSDCFFCQYDDQLGACNCGECPAYRIDDDFNCINDEYGFKFHPIAFYAKLVELNKKRLKAKKR